MTTKEISTTYTPPISDGLRETYEGALSRVPRWQDGLLVSSRDESDLEHVEDCLGILEEIKDRYVHIPSEVNSTTVGHMLYVHDGGEILAGDLAHTHPNYDLLKPQIKRREKAAFRLLTRQIPDAPVRTLARDLYRRCEERRPGDKEAHLADLIDKDQAVRFGIRHVYNGGAIRNRQFRDMHLNHSIGVLLKPARMLLASLDSPYAKAEAVNFVEQEIRNFTMYGYRAAEIRPYVETLHSFSSNGHTSEM